MVEGIGEPDAVGPGSPELDQDLALARLEDVLASLSYERALPDLDVLLQRAGLPEELLRRDERVLKVLHEAVIARPFSTVDDVHRIRTEVELLTLEVELLTDRIDDRSADELLVHEAVTRLDEVRARLDEIRDRL